MDVKGIGMRRIVVVFLTLLTALAFAAPVGAAPPGQGLGSFPVTCGDEEVEVIASSGSSFWIGDQHYLLTSESGTFTPEGGQAEPLGTNTFGKKKGLGSEIICTASFEEPGVGVFDITITAVAVPPTSSSG